MYKMPPRFIMVKRKKQPRITPDRTLTDNRGSPRPLQESGLRGSDRAPDDRSAMLGKLSGAAGSHNDEQSRRDTANHSASSQAREHALSSMEGTRSKFTLQRRQRQMFKMATWNVFSLTGKEYELVKEAQGYQLDIVGLSSTKQKRSGPVDLPNGWKLFLSSVEPTRYAQAGVGVLLSPLLADKVLEIWEQSERTMGLKIQLEKTTLAVVQVYAPNAESEYTAFLMEVEGILEKAAEADDFVLLGDFNAHVGTDCETWQGVIGKNDDAHLNENGRMLLDFCATQGLAIMNTFFQHKDIHKYTWYRDSLGQKSLIDFAIVPTCTLNKVCDVRVLRGAELSTDHHLVLCKLNLRINQIPTRKRRCRAPALTRIKWENLANEEVSENFAEGPSLSSPSFEEVLQAISSLNLRFAYNVHLHI
ncbi:hypothetical protein DMENIID0001_147140 [Sergentomyia squamirostris]